MLIHATVTITGDDARLAECAARLRELLSPQSQRDEVAEQHRPGALCYDLKVEGGIPFPAFAQASQAFPELAFDFEWINVEAGGQGSVRLVGGRAQSPDSGRA
jgi:hypothetical protein